MASRFFRLSKWLLISGGAMMALGLIVALSVFSTGPGSVSAQASPTARPATPAAVTTAAPVATARPATPAPATAVRTATPAAAPTQNPATGDSMTFPALAIALAGAGLVGLGLFARYASGKSKA